MSRPPRWLVITPVLGALALGAAAAWFHFAQRRYLEQTASAALLAVAQAKREMILAWRGERIGDAAVLQEDPLFVRAVSRWLAGHQPDIAADLLTRLHSSKDHYGYDDVRLVDRAGRVVLATSGRRGALGATAAAALRAAFRDRRPTISDVHASSDDSFPHLAIVAPLFDSSGRAAEPIGAVVHVVDARRSLFRLVESWPGRGPSAEALLVQRDGDSVLILSEQRLHPGPALSRRVPLSRRDAPAVMAALGTEGIVRGVDYHGARVIAAPLAVPGTPWLLVVQMDEAEALAVWRTRTALVFGLLLAAVILAGATAIVLAQRSATAHYRRLYEAEAALGASEARHRRIFESGISGIYQTSLEGKLLEANPAFARMLGYASSAEIVSAVVDTAHQLWANPDERAAFRRLVETQGIVREHKVQFVRKDGKRIWVSLNGTVIRMPAGQAPYYQGFITDITDRERAEEALRREHAMLARTESLAHIGSWEWDVATDTTTWSDELFQIFQRDPREGAPSFAEHPAFYHPDDMARLRQAAEAAVAEGTPYELELRALRKDGETRVCVARGVAEMSPGGRAVRLYGSLQDITERKRAEEALRHNREMLHTIVDSAPVMIAFLDRNGQHQLVNRCWQSTLGWSLEETTYTDVFAELYPDPADREQVLDFIANAAGTWADFRLRARDGRVLDASWVNVPLSDGSNVGIGIDITERRRAEEMLRVKDAAIESALNAIAIADRTGHLTYVNPAFLRLWGYGSSAQVIGKPVTAFWQLEEHAVEVVDALRYRGGWTGELVARRDVDGAPFDVQIAASTVVDAAGQPVCMLASFMDITERKQADAALRESEERFRLAIHATFNTVWDWDLQTDALWWSENFQTLFGYRADEVEPDIESWKNRIHPEDFDRVTAGIRAAIDSGRREWSDQYRFRRKDGSYAVVDDRGCIAHAANGIPRRMIGAMEDITERRRAEEALAQETALLAQTEAVSHMGSWRMVLKTGRVTWSDEMYNIFGVERSASAPGGSEAIALRVHPEDRARLDELNAIALRDGISLPADYRIVHPDGTVRWVHWQGTQERDETGHVVALAGFVQDITARKQADEKLRESEERYRGIIEQLNDAYYRTDRNGVITMVSPSAAHLFGFPSTGEMIGQPIKSLWHDPSQRAALLAAIGERGFVRDYEATAVRTDGTPFAVAVSSHYLRDASGAPDGAEGTIRDITERQQAEAALRALALHLDSVREEEHTRIARQIHDELGQALTALRLDLTWARGKIPRGNTALRRRIDAAVALTDETITVGQRIVEGLRPPILDDLGLVPALEWYVQHFAKRSGLRIEFDAGAEEPAVPDHLSVTAYRIVQEALTNVARHAQATHATVYLREQDGAFTIEIRDDGHGLSEEVSLDPHSFGIVGMRERAASHGGALAITSVPGAGTTVRVTFPLERRKERRTPQ